MKNYKTVKTPNFVLTEIAEKFKILRKSKKISQSNLALKSTVSLGSIKRFEQTGHISLESLLKIAHILNRLEDFSSLFILVDDNLRIEKLFKK